MNYILLIKKYRKFRNMTQLELARKAKLNRSYISQLENNHPHVKSPTMIIFFRIAMALDVCPHMLIRYKIDCDYNCFNNCSKNFMSNSSKQI